MLASLAVVAPARAAQGFGNSASFSEYAPATTSTVDVYANYGSMDFGSVTTNGFGGGLRLITKESTGGFIALQLDRLNTDKSVDYGTDSVDLDADLDEFRFGLGYEQPLAPSTYLSGSVSWVRQKMNISAADSSESESDTGWDDGYLIDLGLRYELTKTISASASAGFLNIGSSNGGEYAAELSWTPSRYGWFVQYRYNDYGSDYMKVSSVRTGLRLSF